jgi:hypothetical protein
MQDAELRKRWCASLARWSRICRRANEGDGCMGGGRVMMKGEVTWSRAAGSEVKETLLVCG